MFDDFRQQAEESEFEEEPQETAVAQPAYADAYGGFRPDPPQYFLGMTPVQRFIIALELLFIVCISGGFLLLVFERIVPPFLYY